MTIFTRRIKPKIEPAIPSQTRQVLGGHQGQAVVQIGDDEFETGPGKYRLIPFGGKHRLTNVGEVQLVLIEMLFGSHFGEDDIVQIEDVYGRE